MRVVLTLIITLAATASHATCVGNGDSTKTGKFDVINVNRHVWLSKPWWLLYQLRDTVQSCVITLRSADPSEIGRAGGLEFDVYAIGRPCDLILKPTAFYTAAKACCDQLLAFGGVEENACSLHARMLTEVKVRDAASGKMQTLSSIDQFQKGNDIPAETVEHDWQNYLVATKSRVPSKCNEVGDQNLRDQCWFKTAGKFKNE